MFAVLLAATMLGDPGYNPVLHDKLMGRFVSAVNTAADRHPEHAVTLRAQAEFIRLDAEIRRAGLLCASVEVESAFLLNLINSHIQITRVADRLADPALDRELLATQPPLIWAMATQYRHANRRSGFSLQGLAMWYAYLRDVQPAVARVMGDTASRAARRF